MKETVATKADSELQCAETRARIEEMNQFVESIVNKTVFRVSVMIVSMTLLPLAIAPFYIHGVLCLMDSQ